jgi:hypothetical protein
MHHDQIMESYTPLNNYLSNYVIKLHIKLHTLWSFFKCFAFKKNVFGDEWSNAIFYFLMSYWAFIGNIASTSYSDSFFIQTLCYYVTWIKSVIFIRWSISFIVWHNVWSPCVPFYLLCTRQGEVTGKLGAHGEEKFLLGHKHVTLSAGVLLSSEAEV